MRCALIAAGFLVSALVAGCNDRTPTTTQLYHPPAYHPEDFPDIPLIAVSGYMLDPETDQLAVSYGGGAVRRFEVTMQTRAGAKDEQPIEVLTRYDNDLPRAGWHRMGDIDAGRWRKGAEELRIEVTDSGGTTTVAFHLRPLPPGEAEAAPAPAPAGASLAAVPATVPGPSVPGVGTGASGAAAAP
jgi:hypothetical protein